MSSRLSLYVIAAMLAVTAPPSSGDTPEAARAAYDEAQALKRSNRFNESREAFQRAAEFSGPGASNWAALAADELRYGLPLHEAGTLSMQLTQMRDFPGRHQTLERIEAIYQTLLTDNSDKPERIAEIERRRDQLVLTRQAVGTVERLSTTTHLEQLRQRVEIHYAQQGRWPDRRLLEQELAQTLRDAGLAPDRMTIVNYYPSREMFYAVIRDKQGGPDIKLKGDHSGVRLERQ
jgi:hypothetical protein